MPKWLGWVMIALGVVALTPLGWAAATATAILVPVLSILLALRARHPRDAGSEPAAGSLLTDHTARPIEIG